jgi:hypothetical protein
VNSPVQAEELAGPPKPTRRHDKTGIILRLLLVAFLVLAPFEILFIAAVLLAAAKAGN